MCARFSLSTVAIEQSLLPARIRTTLARILRSEMWVLVRRTTIRFAIGIWHKGVPTSTLDGKLLARIRVFSDAGPSGPRGEGCLGGCSHPCAGTEEAIRRLP